MINHDKITYKLVPKKLTSRLLKLSSIFTGFLHEEYINNVAIIKLPIQYGIININSCMI